MSPCSDERLQRGDGDVLTVIEAQSHRALALLDEEQALHRGLDILAHEHFARGVILRFEREDDLVLVSLCASRAPTSQCV